MLIKKKYIHCYKQDPDQGEKVPDPAGQKSLDPDPDPDPHHYFQVLYVQEVVTDFI